ncbi:ribbon-helix-helix domain-containing protein [Enterocloster citroniae]|uniref:Ribbon-helix-helix protein CopG domain-containing protein n=2 Tax=Enterocloster citroniae TaxID=358743 RepID=A0ABV2G5A6_9FIRM|nr:ribbon-helix-helix protein, CopG family [Enterocloster citroniae]KMW17815.1 hypothetical protein HMPREF9470_03504 [[Clostridium] citroniae WAL-19142]
MRPLKTRISITLDSDILEMIKELAEDDDRSVSQYINIVLKDWITKETSEKSNLSSK